VSKLDKTKKEPKSRKKRSSKSKVEIDGPLPLDPLVFHLEDLNKKLKIENQDLQKAIQELQQKVVKDLQKRQIIDMKRNCPECEKHRYCYFWKTLQRDRVLQDFLQSFFEMLDNIQIATAQGLAPWCKRYESEG